MIEIKAFTTGPLETNCYLVYDSSGKAGFLIDPGTYDKRVADLIDKNGIHIKNIINTHGHVDHTAGNKKFGYPVLIHERDSDFLKDPGKNLSFIAGLMSSSPPASGLLKDGDKLRVDGVTLLVLHTPGHTPGSISLKMGNRVFTGDTLFRDGVGRTDFPYGSESALRDSIKKCLMVLPDDVEVLPGHGPSSTIGYERKNNPFL